ncbi:MAG: dTDP-4-dehydrorhamnose reductase [Betaproteobacteria bacterium]|nr:dTDP-4-dehydrorhamnose reductase [Betaproteobacteria bacterium]NDE54009.1 dTDP-4-dehydrorhamnose reductase [Actinomycetota bacterium]
MTRVMVLGASGQLGWQCLHDLPAAGFDVLGLGRDTLDVSRHGERQWRARLETVLRDFDPHWVINALAYTAVDRAEDEPEMAIQVNATFPQVLAQTIRAVLPTAFLLQCSTDYVFDGLSALPYREQDQTDPKTAYGKSKLLGERAVLSGFERSFVLRFSWVVGEHGQNFPKTMLRLASEREQLRVVGDQRGVPSPTPFLVGEFIRLMRYCAKLDAASGVLDRRLFHVVPSGESNWHAYAQWCLEIAASDPIQSKRLKLSSQDIERIQTEEYPTKAARPRNSLLNCASWCELHDITMLPDWITVTKPVVEKICMKIG